MLGIFQRDVVTSVLVQVVEDGQLIRCTILKFRPDQFVLDSVPLEAIHFLQQQFIMHKVFSNQVLAENAYIL